MGNAFHDRTVVVVGRGSGIARAVALRATRKVRESS
jgi:NAD(P)-dependent dehydrogenase (short-subunit alcohol dehydrogenase family)